MQQKRPPTGLWIGFSVSVTLFVLFIIAANTGGAPSSSSTATNTDTATPTQQVIATMQPTDTPVPTPTPHLAVQPTHAPPPSPQPTPTPVPCGDAGCNPWGYNFEAGNLIYSPPSGFCSYFNCIPTFVEPDDPGDGYVVECQDSTFSQSGSERGACSYHGGVARPLYSH